VDKHQVIEEKFKAWRKDWCLFAREMLHVTLDEEQEAVLRSVQFNKMTSVASGTARGKDFVAAVAGICFLYLTPVWNDKGELIANTKVAMTAPTDRQVENIMVPEISRIFQRAKFLSGRLTGYDIRTDNKEWFLTGFKADEKNTEAWSGFHAVNTMFIVTEASGLADLIYAAIEGNLQGNSRILLVFNPNISTGYAAASQKSPRWHKFRLDSFNAPNVVQKKMVIPGQVDYEWVADKVKEWCMPISVEDFNEGEGDFFWEGFSYRPNDLFRVKVRGMFPKVGEDVLIPLEWVRLAQARWKEQGGKQLIQRDLRIGVDVAGMGRDSSMFCHRYKDYVEKFEGIQSAGIANHTEIAGKLMNLILLHNNRFNGKYAKAFIDTIGEGAGVYSILLEKKVPNAVSAKFSEAAKDRLGNPLTDLTGEYEFLNMRAYSHWAVRDWLNPANKRNAMLPDDDQLTQELTEIRWKFRSDGRIQIEAKEDIVARLRRSPDKSDALANTFWAYEESKKQNLGNIANALP
jgi:hypothetical protein